MTPTAPPVARTPVPLSPVLPALGALARPSSCEVPSAIPWSHEDDGFRRGESVAIPPIAVSGRGVSMGAGAIPIVTDSSVATEAGAPLAVRTQPVRPVRTEMLVFDLDGTFAELYETEREKARYEDPDKTLDENIRAFVAFKEREGIPIIFASARTLSNFQKFQQELSERGITLPTPDYYVSNNGNFIYEKNAEGQLVLDKAYAAELLRRTGFNRDAIYAKLKEMGYGPRYRFPDGKGDLPAPDGTPPRLMEFAGSRLAYYEFFPSESFIELMYAPEAHATIAEDLAAALKELGVVSSLTWKKFPAANLDWIGAEARKRPELNEILRLARPTRLDADGGLYTVHISAAQKRTAVEYLMETLGIPPEGVVAAGNDMNDLSLAQLSHDRGTWFISVANASEDFKRAVEELYTNLILRRERIRLMRIPIYEANESVRHGLNIIGGEIHDAKAKYYRAAIDRIAAGTPGNDGEAAVWAEFMKSDAQKAVAERAERMFWTMPDEWPERLAREHARNTATDKALIKLLESFGVGEMFRWENSDVG